MMQDLSQPDITNEDVKTSESQIARIYRMEEILDKSSKAVREILPTMRQANFPGI